MSLVVQKFLTELFDTTQFNTSDYIEDDSLNMTKVMKSPILKINIMYSLLWNLIYGTWPTKMDFHEYIYSNPSQHDPSTILSSFLPLKVVQIDVTSISSRFNTLSQHIDNPDFIKENIIEKWRWRYPETIPDSSTLNKSPLSLLQLFLKYVPQNKEFIDTTSPIRLPSGNIDPHPTIQTIQPTTRTEFMQYLIHKDIHFIRLIANGGITTINNDDVIRAIEEATNAIPYIIKNSEDPLWKYYPKMAKISVGSINLCKDVKNFFPIIPNDIPSIIDDFTITYYSHIFKNSRDVVYIKFLSDYLKKHKDRIASLKKHQALHDNVCILIDNRPNPLSVASLIFAGLNLDLEQWDILVYTSSSAVSYYEKQVGSFVKVYAYDDLNINKFNIDVYNRILMSTKFWDSLATWSKALIIQDDGILVRPGAERFLEYDYIGAPWADAPENAYLKSKVNSQLVGNGGLSLRSIAVMRDICERYKDEKNHLFYHNIIRIPEDVYFVRALCSPENSGKYKLPSTKTASDFSVEQLMNMGSIGIHKPWMYHKPEVILNYFNRVLEA